ncbi:unnamed protein product, partial [Urochloa humidicola]
ETPPAAAHQFVPWQQGVRAEHGGGGFGKQGESGAGEDAVAAGAGAEEPRHGGGAAEAAAAEAGEGGRRVLPLQERAPRAPALHGGRAPLPRRPLPPRCDRPARRAERQGHGAHVLVGVQEELPQRGREYVLKGTERLHPPALPPPPPPAAALLDAAAASSSSSGSQDTPTSSSSARWDAHRSKSDSAELGEYVVYKGEDRAADAATQTEDAGAGRPRRAHAKAAQEELRLSRADTTSPPPTASTSPETLEALIRADGRVVAAVSGSGRARASSVLMQLISCGSVSVRDARASPVMPRAHRHHHHHTHHHRARPPRPPAAAAEAPSFRAKIVEDKEYFSGSIIETARRSRGDDAAQDVAVLRRSSSYNADRVIKLELAKEAGDLHDRCIPRKPKPKKDGGYLVISFTAQGNNKG